MVKPNAKENAYGKRFGGSSSSSSSNNNNNKPKSTRTKNVQPHEESKSSVFSLTYQCLSVFFLLSTLYVYTTYPSVPGGDSGELLSAACEFGVPHPPGYPLWTLMSMAVIRFFSIGNAAWRVNVLNCILAACSSAVLHGGFVRLTGSVTGSLLAALIYSLNPLVWTWSITGEVFALNNLCTACLIFLLIEFELSSSSTRRKSIVFLGSITAGLSICNQHTIMLLLPFMIFRILYKLWTVGELTTRLVMKSSLCGLIGISFYVYLPIASYINVARWSWGDQTSLSGFITHVLRKEYGTFSLGKDGESKGFIHNLAEYKLSMIRDFHWMGYALGCLGLVQTFIDCSQSVRRSAQICLVMLIFYVSFFCWRANLDVSNLLFKEVVERFWLQPHILWSVMVAMGYKLLHVRLLMRVNVNVWMKCGAVVLLVASCLANSFVHCNHRHDYVVANFAKSMLVALPNNSLVLTRGDLPSATFRYSQFCEGVRPDITLVEQETLSYDWFLPKMEKIFPSVYFPGDRWHPKIGKVKHDTVLFNFKEFITANYGKRPIFICIGMQDNDNSWQSSYSLLPYGVCHQIVRSAADWVEHSHPYIDTWSKEFIEYRAGTWEEIANEEMWNAKIAKALQLYNDGERLADEKLHGEAFKVYDQLIRSHKLVPTYYHKNYALSCHKMSLLSQTSVTERKRYLELAVYHFTHYMHSGVKDEQISAIHSLVLSLNETLKNYQ